tara:strand:- start:542 stop:694 length:153 start_codon:yes stop_codon:yes gene_type:complete
MRINYVYVRKAMDFYWRVVGDDLLPGGTYHFDKDGTCWFVTLVGEEPVMM